MSIVANPRVQLVLRLLLRAFFVYASLDKIASPRASRGSSTSGRWRVPSPRTSWR
jgi:hypothetical protein